MTFIFKLKACYAPVFSLLARINRRFFYRDIFILIAGLIGAAISSAGSSSGAQSLAKADAAVLTLNLRSGFIDHGGEGAIFGGDAPSLVTTVRALNRAKSDKKIKGLLIRANGWGMSPAQAEE